MPSGMIRYANFRLGVSFSPACYVFHEFWPVDRVVQPRDLVAVEKDRHIEAIATWLHWMVFEVRLWCDESEGACSNRRDFHESSCLA